MVPEVEKYNDSLQESSGRARVRYLRSARLKRQRKRHRLIDKCIAVVLQHYAMPKLGMANAVHIYIVYIVLNVSVHCPKRPFCL